MCSHSDRPSETVHVGNQLLEVCLRLAVLRIRFLYIYLWLSIVPSWRGQSNVPHTSSPIDHVPVRIAWIDALCVRCRRLLSVIYVDQESIDRPKYNTKPHSLLRRFLELSSRLFVLPFENIQPVVLRLYILVPFEKGLFEQLVLGLRSFCASHRGVRLGAERGEFLFVSKEIFSS